MSQRAGRELKRGTEPRSAVARDLFGTPLGGDTTRLMGVVNVTPDSFFDGGRHGAASAAIDHALRLLDEGADILDIGGESTRPGHAPVGDDEQLRRVLPVVEGLVARGIAVPLSIDTTRARVAQETLDAGAHWINDTLALGGDPELGAVVAAAGCPVVLMHRFDPPRSAADDPPSDHRIVAHIAEALRSSCDRAIDYGIDEHRIILDPGIGFGTRHDDNVAMHAFLPLLRRLGRPLLCGPSRKSFLGALTGKTDPADRLFATAASIATLALAGVEILRVHDVAAMRDVVSVADAIRRSGRSLPFVTGDVRAEATDDGSEPPGGSR